MGFMKWINRVVFGAESVAKSAGKEAVHTGKEAMEDLAERAEELYDKGKDKAAEWGDELVDKFEDLTGSKEEVPEESQTDELVNDILSDEKESPTAEESLADKPPTGPKPGDKTKEFIEKTGEKVLSGMDTIVEKGEEILEKKGELFEQAKEKIEEATDKLKAKYDDLVEKAEESAREDAREKAENPTGFREDSTHADQLKKTDILSGTDDFFDKADSFAKGNYGAFTDEPQISKDPTAKKEEVDDRSTYGFEDLDGDGNDIIDEAIIDDSEEE